MTSVLSDARAIVCLGVGVDSCTRDNLDLRVD